MMHLNNFSVLVSSRILCLMRIEGISISQSHGYFNLSFCMVSLGKLQSYYYTIAYSYYYMYFNFIAIPTRFSKTQLSKKIENEFMVVRGLILPFYFRYIHLYLAICIATCAVDLIGISCSYSTYIHTLIDTYTCIHSFIHACVY